MIVDLEINGARVRISGDNLSVAVDEAAIPEKDSVRPTAFPLPSHIVTLADLYCARKRIAASTLSTTIFNDGKRVERLRSGLGLTVQSYNDAMRFFSGNWGRDWDWPQSIPRPMGDAA